MMPQLLDRFRGKKICVVGDVIADIYIYGRPHKLSREAPVVVVKYEEERICPGSAGNTMNNLLALGAHVFPLGFIGRDEAGQKLFDYFSGFGNIRMDGFIRHNGRTVTKTRILAGDTHTSKQQVIRVDNESGCEVNEEARNALLGKLAEFAPLVDAFVFSDYEYGLIDGEVIAQARRLAKDRVVVGDSRYHLQSFIGFTLVTPNESEAYGFVGADIGRDVERVGRQIMSVLNVRALLITRGNKGMTLFLQDGSVHHIPISGTDEIADVTGAGDTVAAAVTLALASGADFLTAALIANHAGGVVVMKRGTAVVTIDELRKVVDEHGTVGT